MKKILAVEFILSMVILTFSQQPKYPFPQEVKYPYGYMPTTFSTKNFENWYSNFKKNNFWQSCNDGIAPRTDNGTKVEAMGWSMIIAAYMGDKETFDGLYKYYKSKIQGHGMMAWLTTCGGVTDAGSASDGDLDVAFSLVVASWQWGEEYKKEAIKVINTVRKLITNCNGVAVLYGGYGSDGRTPYGGCSRTDISYYTPAFFREFAKLTGDTIWKKLADDTYIVLNNGAHPTTGLVPDWQTYDGRPDGNYGYDACRVPWRITLDYLWNGNEEARKWCTKVASWAYKIGPANIKSNYNLDGSGGGGWPGMSYVGAFAVAAMAHSQEVADAFGKHIASMSFDSYWYHAYLGNCYMLTLSGNMWRPGLSGVRENENDKKRFQKNSLTIKILQTGELIFSNIEKNSKITLLSPDGKKIKGISLKEKDGSNSHKLDLSSLKRGCYLVVVEAPSFYESRVITIY